MSKKWEKRQQSGAETQSETVAEKIDFDAWWSSKKSKIPVIHYKEIVKADFKGQGVPESCTAEEFNEALAIYGVKVD